MSKTFLSVTRMCPNIWNAHRMQSEFFKCSSIVKEYTTNFHSDGNLTHSGTSMAVFLGRSTLRCAATAESGSSRRSRFGEEKAVRPPTKTSAPNMVLLHSGPLLVTSLPVGVRSTAMSVSVRLWVCLSVRSHISKHVPKLYCGVTSGRGSAVL